MNRVRQYERVKETSTSTGTGGIVVAGAMDGGRTFAEVLVDAEYCHVAFEHDTLDEWEVALCEWDEGSLTLTRLQTLTSSNAGAVVNFSSGDKTVFLVAAANHATDLTMFGSSTNDVTIVGSTTLAANTWYGNLVLEHTLIPDGYIWAVSGVLDLDHASAVITADAGVGQNGSGSVGGGIDTGSTSREWGGSGNGGAGGTGTSGVGNAGSSGSAPGQQMGGAAGAGGAGGAGVSAGGGSGNPGSKSTTPRNWISDKPRDWVGTTVVSSTTPLNGGCGAGGGGSGGAGGGNNGRGGGSGGRGARFLTVIAAVILTGASTPAAVINGIGAAGGNGVSSGLGTITGGGGGGGGGGGSFVLVICGYRIGAAVTNIARATGGAGGNGGTSDFGTAGTGGTGGTGGRILAAVLSSGVLVDQTGSAGSGPTGTTGGAGGACNATF